MHERLEEGERRGEHAAQLRGARRLCYLRRLRRLRRRRVALRLADDTEQRLDEVGLLLLGDERTAHVGQPARGDEGREDTRTRELKGECALAQVEVTQDLLRLRVDHGLRLALALDQHVRLGAQVEHRIAHPLRHLVVAAAALVVVHLIVSSHHRVATRALKQRGRRRRRRIHRLDARALARQRGGEQLQGHRLATNGQPRIRVEGVLWPRTILEEQGEVLHAPDDAPECAQHGQMGYQQRQRLHVGALVLARALRVGRLVRAVGLQHPRRGAAAHVGPAAHQVARHASFLRVAHPHVCDQVGVMKLLVGAHMRERAHAKLIAPTLLLSGDGGAPAMRDERMVPLLRQRGPRRTTSQRGHSLVEQIDKRPVDRRCVVVVWRHARSSSRRRRQRRRQPERRLALQLPELILRGRHVRLCLPLALLAATRLLHLPLRLVRIHLAALADSPLLSGEAALIEVRRTPEVQRLDVHVEATNKVEGAQPTRAAE